MGSTQAHQTRQGERGIQKTAHHLPMGIQTTCRHPWPPDEQNKRLNVYLWEAKTHLAAAWRMIHQHPPMYKL
jgi:hypothetical protein